MNVSNSLLVAAVGGILLGATGCGGGSQPEPATEATPAATPAPVVPGAAPADPAAAPAATGEKMSCKGLNDCKGKGGCKSDKHDCKGKNDCKGQGGCKG
jgi:hypothetical protein